MCRIIVTKTIAKIEGELWGNRPRTCPPFRKDSPGLQEKRIDDDYVDDDYHDWYKNINIMANKEH